MLLQLADEPNKKSTESSSRAAGAQRFGWIAVILGLAALTSSVIPHYVFGEPLPNPFARAEVTPPPPVANAPLIVIEGDKLAKKLEDAEQVANRFVAKKVGRVGDAAKGLQRRLGLMKERPADALLPENVHPPEIVAAKEDHLEAVAQAAQPVIAAPQPAAFPIGRIFLLAAVFFAIASLPVALASWTYERQLALPISAVSCGVLAVTWQYVLVGMMIGAAMAVFLYVLAKLLENGG